MEDFDARALQIKGWSVTVSLAGIAAALIAKDVPFDLKALACGVAGIAALSFWMIEFAWKRFQWSFKDRARVIESAFSNGTAESLPPLQIGTAFGTSISKLKGRDFLGPFYPFIMLPHAAIAAVGFYLALQFWSVAPGEPVHIFGKAVSAAAGPRS